MPLLGEMRRRNIFKVSLAYAIVSWLIVQVADVILPTFNAPLWTMQILVVVLVLLFPIAVLLAWAYELTPEGFKPTSDVDRTQSITVNTGRKLNHIVISLMAVSIVFLVLDNYVFKTEAEPDPDVAYRQSIAVLPFINRSAAEENAGFLADGIHDELLTRLSKVSDLRVISRTSVMQYRDTTRNVREIGAALGVGSILEGGVQRAGNEIRINVQLIDARTDEHIWADTFDRELSAENLFAIQTEIAVAIADVLEATLSAEEDARIAAVPTEDLGALETYFAGKQLVEERTTASLLAAIEAFELATSIDPEFAAAWAGIAEAWLELPNYSVEVDPNKVRRNAGAAAIRAVMLDPESPQALAALGWHLTLHNYDWMGAENAFRQALAIEARNVNALHWYSHLLSWQGKHEDAISAARLAVEADPFSMLFQTSLAYILSDARRWEDAAMLERKLLDRGEYAPLLGNMWVSRLRSGQPEEARQIMLDWAGATGRDVEAVTELGQLIVRGMTTDETVEIPDELLERVRIPMELPEIYAAVGDADKAIAALESSLAIGRGSRSLLSARINPSYDFLRDDPRFAEILEEIGLPP